jgi:hypothetical protein
MSVFGRVLVHIGTGLLFASVVVRGAQGGAYPEIRPVDEASQQADFFTFRAHLQAAIARHDPVAVLAVVNVNIRNTFGGDNGREAFERLWRLESPDTELWEKLGSALALGGTFEANGTFVAPYTFSRWPEKFDPFDHIAIVGSRVRVHEAPLLDSGTLGVLSFAVVPIPREARPPTADQARQWTAVRLLDRRIGYVASQYVRSPIDYRAIFARVGAEWQLTTFVSGD